MISNFSNARDPRRPGLPEWVWELSITAMAVVGVVYGILSIAPSQIV